MVPTPHCGFLSKSRAWNGAGKELDSGGTGSCGRSGPTLRETHPDVQESVWLLWWSLLFPD